MPHVNPRLFVISGPSGAGKGTLVACLRRNRPQLALTVSATTRAPRDGEVDGTHYHFLTDDEFDRLIAAGEFLEWARVHGHRYGTLRHDVEAHLAAGCSVLLEIDVQGALNVRRAYPDAVLVFIAPPSLDELGRRLRARNTDDDESISVRLSAAVRELEAASCYDAVIVNDDLEAATVALEETVSRYETDGGPFDVRDESRD